MNIQTFITNHDNTDIDPIRALAIADEALTHLDDHTQTVEARQKLTSIFQKASSAGYTEPDIEHQNKVHRQELIDNAEHYETAGHKELGEALRQSVIDTDLQTAKDELKLEALEKTNERVKQEKIDTHLKASRDKAEWIQNQTHMYVIDARMLEEDAEAQAKLDAADIRFDISEMGDVPGYRHADYTSPDAA